MTYLMRTTITLPESLLEQAKYYAVANKTTVSRLIKEGLAIKIKAKINNKPKSILTLAGSINLGGKERQREMSFMTHTSSKNWPSTLISSFIC